MDKDASKTTDQIVLASSVASIALSLYLYNSGKRETGIFVGLWAPTILAVGTFLKASAAATPSGSVSEAISEITNSVL